jgi:L-amino acid N-acyltransferase
MGQDTIEKTDRAAARPVRPGAPTAVRLRRACLGDAAEIAAIWNREVLGSDTTTDTEPRRPEEQQAWLAGHTEDHPVIVAVSFDTRAARGSVIVGYGALSPYRDKPAFRRTVENSVYVKAGRRGEGLGSLILGRLVELACERGHHTIIARITATNAGSRRLHERHGFELVGVERETAFKLGRWLDVAIMQRRLDGR